MQNISQTAQENSIRQAQATVEQEQQQQQPQQTQDQEGNTAMDQEKLVSDQDANGGGRRKQEEDKKAVLVTSAVSQSAEAMSKKKTMSMTAEEMKQLEIRFRNILKNAVSSGTFLNTSFTGTNGALNVEEFTKYILEQEEEDVVDADGRRRSNNKNNQSNKNNNSNTNNKSNKNNKNNERNRRQSMKPAQVDWFLNLLDTNGDGKVDYREFLHFTYNSPPAVVSSTHGTPEKSKNDHNLEYQVDAFAKDLSNIFMDVVNSGKVNDFRDIFQTMDSDNSGTVSHSEFVTALEKFNFFLPNNDIR